MIGLTTTIGLYTLFSDFVECNDIYVKVIVLSYMCVYTHTHTHACTHTLLQPNV